MGTDFTSSGYGECKHYARMGNGIFVDWINMGDRKAYLEAAIEELKSRDNP